MGERRLGAGRWSGGLDSPSERIDDDKTSRLKLKYSPCPTFFVLFEKLNFLREHNLLSYLSFKNVKVFKTTFKKIYQKIELVN